MRKGLIYGVWTGVCALLLVLTLVWPAKVDALAKPPKTFSSYQELVSYIKNNTKIAQTMGYVGYYGRPGGIMLMEPTPRMAVKAQDESVAQDYSTTNVQVQGVDEADIVKSDGRYLYLVKGKELLILEAYPPQEAKILTRFKAEAEPLELFVAKDRLCLFSSGEGFTAATVYDVSNRAQPKMVRNVEVRGNYVTSRMIGGYVYLLTRAETTEGEKILLPEIRIDGRKRTVQPREIQYFSLPDFSYVYSQLTVVNLSDPQYPVNHRTFLTGASQNVFASRENIYLTNEKTPDYQSLTDRMLRGMASLVPGAVAKKINEVRLSTMSLDEKLMQVESILEEYMATLDYEKAAELEAKIEGLKFKWQQDILRQRGKTVVHKLALKNGSVNYAATGEVLGQVLNQFSMDEHKGYFRIATTSESWLLSPGRTRNNLYVMDSDLKVVGSIQGLAPGERIYSVRFLGDKGYLVTFRQVDPLFVLDLKDPKRPKVAGKLKIPGYSSYLHPWGNNYLLGIGKEVAETGNEDSNPSMGTVPPLPRPQGVKIALFDVSNPSLPREVAKYVVEGWSESEALNNHKAVLANEGKNLLVLPITIGYPVRILKEGKEEETGPWQGFYVFEVSPQGIKIKGKIEQKNDQNQYYWSWVGGRSLYIKDNLYTVTPWTVKILEMSNLKEVKEIKLEADSRN